MRLVGRMNRRTRKPAPSWPKASRSAGAHRHAPSGHDRHSQAGFTLLETLAALLVLSVGLLGIAALHTQSLVVGRTAHYRTLATNLVADMAERIRGNPLALDAYAGAGADNHCAATAGGGSADCTAAQMAAHDLYLWERAVQTSLPNGDWRIQVNAGAVPPSYRLEVYWDEIGRGRIGHEIDIRVSTT